MLVGLRPSAIFIAISAAGAHFALPFVVGLNQAIWQAEVPPELQGRVFALREMLVRAGQPLAPLAAGLLADRLFASLLLPGSPLAAALGPLLGIGVGRGLGLLFLIIGAVALALTVQMPRLLKRSTAGYLSPATIQSAPPAPPACH